MGGMYQMKLPEYTLIRKYNDYLEGTTGIITDTKGKKIVCTLEPPNRNNSKDNPQTKVNEAGCIPEGIYICRKRDPEVYKNAHFKDNWEILNVPNKEGCVFHGGNLWTDSKSCILVASSIQNMNPKNDPDFDPIKKWWASQSQMAMKAFNNNMPIEFTLKIISV